MSNPRLMAIFDDLVTSIKDVLRKHQVTHEEYRQAVAFAQELADAGEIPLFSDVFFEMAVVETNDGQRPGTSSTVEGPYYVEGAPLLERPFQLPRRLNEPGEVLIFSGTVRTADGSPLAGAVLDMWQADAEGCYSNYHPGIPTYNLRGRFQSDDQGRFEVRTIVPAPYEIPKSGPTGKLLLAIGQHAFRPAHLHFKVSHEGYQPLTTQIYFKGDPWLDSDVARSVKDSLVIQITRHENDEKQGLDRAYFTGSYDFVLAPVSEAIGAMASH